MTTSAPATTAIDDLVREHMALVGHLVREVMSRVPAHVSRDDLTSAGLAALVAAARSFDPERGTTFGRFAATRIRGALIDELRGLDWASRSVRHRARRAESARQELTAALGRSPRPEEVAAHLGVDVADLSAVEEDVHRAMVLSLHGFANGTAEELVTERAAGPEEMLLHRERIGYLHHAIAALPERLRTVVDGYFLREQPMAVIAQQLGVSESRVSQLRAEALTLLRDGMNSQLDPELLGEAPQQRDTCVARRRVHYYRQVAAAGDLTSRLALTTIDGLPAAA